MKICRSVLIKKPASFTRQVLILSLIKDWFLILSFRNYVLQKQLMLSYTF
jgi:hypothetical protein